MSSPSTINQMMEMATILHTSVNPRMKRAKFARMPFVTCKVTNSLAYQENTHQGQSMRLKSSKYPHSKKSHSHPWPNITPVSRIGRRNFRSAIRQARQICKAKQLRTMRWEDFYVKVDLCILTKRVSYNRLGASSGHTRRRFCSNTWMQTEMGTFREKNLTFF